MKLLVLAQTPPPLHGQSFMVQTLLDGLPALGFELEHVPLRFSRDATEIGRLQPRKLFTALQTVRHARAALSASHPDAVYYVPAPGNRAALWRDILVVGRLRRHCPKLVLHFHAAGLAAWLDAHATAAERRLALHALGEPDLALVLTPSLAADAAALRARRTEMVANGIPDPLDPPSSDPARTPGEPPLAPRAATRRILFLGALTLEKGVAVLIQAANQLHTPDRPIELILAGDFMADADRATLHALAAQARAKITFSGFVGGEAKSALLASADAFCLPTYYPHEAQPLVLLEALAHDRPIVATRWRGIPETLPPGTPLAEPRDAASLAAALRTALDSPPPRGRNRAHFLAHFTRERHLASLAATLRTLA